MPIHLARLAALALALPLLGGCIVATSETVTGTVVYPPGTTTSENPDDYGTGVPRPTGEAARPAYKQPDDPYQQAVMCAAAQRKLLTLNTYMVTRQDLYDMEDAISAWTDIAITLGAERGKADYAVVDEINRTAASLGGREADRIAGGCIVNE